MSFNVFRLIYFVMYLAIVAATVRPYDALTWSLCGIGLMGAVWILYWLPYRIIELQDQMGPVLEAMKDERTRRKEARR